MSLTTTTRMRSEYREFTPHPALRRFVDRFWTRAGDAGSTEEARILPDGCIDLLVDLEAGATTAVGAMTRALVFQRRGGARMVAVRFRPGGAIPFLRVPADELTDRRVDSADLGIGWITADRFDDDDVAAGVPTLERVLLDRLRTVDPPKPEVARAVATLFAPRPPSITELARRLGWSRQHLGRAVRHHVGVSPSRLARVARLQRATALLQSGREPGLATAALRAGYFDQAHMTRDFRDLAGVTPRVAAASPGSIRPIHSLLASL